MLGVEDADLHMSDDGSVPLNEAQKKKKKKLIRRVLCSLSWVPVYKYDQKLAIMSIAFLVERDDAVIWRGPKKTGKKAVSRVDRPALRLNTSLAATLLGMIQQFLSEARWGELDYLIIDTPPGQPLSFCEKHSVLSWFNSALPIPVNLLQALRTSTWR